MEHQISGSSQKSNLGKIRWNQVKGTSSGRSGPRSNPLAAVQRAVIAPDSLTPADVVRLQRAMGNQAVRGLFERPAAQAETAGRENPGGKEIKMKLPECSSVLNSVIQPKWIDIQGQYYMWDQLLDGVQWYVSKSTPHKMYYIVISEEGAKYSGYSGIQHTRERSEWLALNGGEDKYANKDSAIVPPLKIANIASGTDVDTLMQPLEGDSSVMNFDTGHMAISDVLLDCNDAGAWKILAVEITKRAEANRIKISFPSDKKMGGKTKDVWLAEQMIKVKSAAAAYLKQLLGDSPNMAGAMGIFKLLPEPIQQKITEKLQGLKNFTPGDLAVFSGHAAQVGGMDEVHIVNALHFDPIGDPMQSIHLVKGIKPGGVLIITAESSGDSVRSLFPEKHFDDATMKSNFPKLEISKFFDIESVTVGPKSSVMSSNKHTRTVNTRHTMKGSEGATKMQENETVRIVFKRKEL